MAEEQVKLTETNEPDVKPTKKVTFNEELETGRSKCATRRVETRPKKAPVRKIHRDTKKRTTTHEAATMGCTIVDRPELNSALSIAERIQTLELEPFDGKEAVKIKLKTCCDTRQRLEEASTKAVNHRPGYVVFRDVVPLEFDEEALLRAAAEEKEAKVRAVQPAPRPRDPEPKLEDFVTEEELFQPEFAKFPTVSGADGFKRTVTVPRRSAYNLYRHQLRWEEDD